MCEFFNLSASGTNFDAAGIPGNIEANGRVTLDCSSVIVRVFNNQNVLVFESVEQPGNTISQVNGIDTRLLIVAYDNSVTKIACDERVSVEFTCESNPSCTDKNTVQVGCKDNPNPPCPDSNALEIVLTDNGGNVILPGQSCIPAGTYSAELTGAPAGTQVFWSMQVGGVTTQLGSTNPVQFTIGGGTDSAVLSAIVIAPNCPPVVETLALPDRQTGVCPTAVTFEIRKDGQVIAGTTGLEAGTYQVNVLDPLGAGHSYTFSDNNGQIQFGPSPTADFVLPGGGVTNTITVSVASGDCCGLITANEILESGVGTGNPPDDTPPDDDDDDGFDWPSLCGIFYGILIVLVAVFIGLWVASFTLFPASTAIWVALGIAFAAVLVALAVYSWVCNVSWCRRLRILGWMFAWSMIGCLIAWIVSLFTLWFLLIGALVAGVIAMVIGIQMARRGCDFLDLFDLP